MRCESFEDLLTVYRELPEMDRIAVNAHLSTCPGCREYLDALTQLDESLTALYSGFAPQRGIPLVGVKRPTMWPEVLDFCGWVAVVAAVAFFGVMIAKRFDIALTLASYTGWYLAVAAGALFCAGLGVVGIKPAGASAEGAWLHPSRRRSK